jgi:PKD repeat protein
LGVVAVLVLAALLVWGSGQRAEAGLQSVWAVDDGEKIFRGDTNSPLESSNSVWDGSDVSLFAAKNEIVAFQLILEADGSGANTVDVTVSDLTNGGYTINGSHPLPDPNDYVGVGVELFTEHYLDVSVLSGDPLEGYFNWAPSAAPAVSGMTTGWMPDALVPFSAAQGKGGAPFDISANQNQGVWVDIYVDKGLPAGTYTGTMTVTVGGNPMDTIPVSLQVLDFTLPDQNHYRSMVYYSLWDCVMPRYNLTEGSPEYWEMARNHHRMAHRHRVDLIGAGDWSPINNIPGILDGSAYTTGQGYEGPGESVGNGVYSIGTYGGWWNQNQSYYQSESDAWVNWFNANAPGVDYFMYLVDEPGSDLYEDIKTRCNWIHNNSGPGKDLPVLVTTSIKGDLIGYVDIWCSPTGAWDSVSTADAEARGEQVYSYAAHRPKTPSDVTDDWGIAFRLKPWIAYQWDVTRWFTWESTHYERNPNEIDPGGDINVWVDPLTFHTPNASETGNGDGLMIYPGRDYVFSAQDREYGGPVASYRLKMYRRGAQDFEYMWLAEQAGNGAEVQNILQDILPHTMDNELTVPDWSNADAPYEEARAELADLVLGTVRAPSAKFQADTTRGVSPLNVNFTDLSVFNPTSWDWTFGDGGTSTAQNPSHTYSGSGSFTVSLTASNAQGQNTEVKYDYIILVQEAVYIPDTWTTQPGWADTEIVSGSLSDLQEDDQSYMVMEPTNAEKQYSVLYTADTPYTASEVSRITMEYQAKASSGSTPGSGLVFVQMSDLSWQYLGGWLMGTGDTDWTWETTDPGSYMTSNGVVGFEFCGCPNGTADYTISSDVMRFRLELAGVGPVAPVADFSGSPTSGDAPLTVYFTDLSTNTPTSWDWTFGDGGSSTAQSPSHDYTSDGDYTVSLTATNSAGSDTETKTDYISVSSAPQPPVADFSGSPTSGDAPLTVSFTDLSTNSPTSWDWTFGDGGSSTAQHPSHDYTGAGDYTVGLTAANAGGSDTETKTGYISVSEPPPPPPVADFSGSPTSGDAPLTVSFTDLSTNSPTSWEWTFGDGGSSTAQNPSHQYTGEGDYTVGLTATNAGGSDTETKTDYISVTTGGGPVTIFSDDFEAEFSGWTTYDTVEWYTGSPKNGTHSIRLRRDGTIEQTIPTAGYQNISVSFYLGAYSLDNANENVQALWYDGVDWTVLKQIDNGDPEEDQQLHYFSYSLPAGANENPNFALQFRINGSGTGDYGYVDDVVVEGEEAPPSAPIAEFTGSPVAGQAPLTVNFSDLSLCSPTAWDWTFGDGATSTAQNPSHDYTSAGDYTVALTATNAQGEDTETKVDYVAVVPSGSPDTIFSDDFEAGLSGWTTGGNVNWYNGEPSNGAYSAQLLKVGSMDRTISTVGYEYIKVSFSMGAYSLDNANENVEAHWSANGTDWTLLKRIEDGDPEEDNQLHSFEYWLPAAADDNADFALWFKINGSGTKDYMYVDDVVVSGFAMGGPTPPVAEFSGSPTSGDAPLTVSFTDLSTNSPTSWDWTFGDGGSSTAQNPSHDYTSAGDYTVSLTATNAGGSDTETKTDYISVSEPPPPPPVADFSGSPTSGDAPLTVSFTDLSTNSPTSWDWTFGDGGSSTAQNPSHDYTSAGDYTVSLTAANAGGSDTETKTDYISVSEPPPPPPVADFSGSPTSGDAPLTVSFTDLSTNSPTSWDWDFGDTGTSTAQNPSHDYTSAGDYTVSLTAANAGGSDIETKTDYISVGGAGSYVYAYPDAYATPSDWARPTLVSGGLSDLQADDQSYMVMQSDTANQRYWVEYTADTAYTPGDVTELTLEYQAKRSRSDTPDPGLSLVWIRKADGTWYNSGSWLPGTSDSTHTWNTTDVATYVDGDGVVGYRQCACPTDGNNNDYTISSDLLRFRLDLTGGAPPVADFSGSPTSGNAPLTVNFTDLSTNSPTSWDWDFGDAGTSTAENPSHSYTGAGDYTVSLTATNASGSATETKTDYISVTVPEVYVYPISWTSWAGVSLLSGALVDLETDDDSYMVYRCNTSNQQFQVEYQWDTDYAPADVSQIRVELQFKGSEPDTPAYGLLIQNYDTGGWDDLRERTPGWPTTDAWFTWDTTDVSTYLSADGEMVITYCGCPQHGTIYDTSIDVTRVKFTLN